MTEGSKINGAAAGLGRTLRDATFVHSAVLSPALVGAMLPSSRWLAHSMARSARGAHLLVDLGAGTGAITAALVEHHPGVPLVAVEMQARLASLLARRFPQVDVRHAAAHDVLDSLHDAPADTVLVSSLPFRSLPEPWRQRSMAAIEAFLNADSTRRLVQYTYQPRAPFAPLSNGLRWHREHMVWRNAPPAAIWTLQRH
ncbi:class I SAM-dependent methyltransferase [Rivibacter subsaxonicus]|uniref:Phosphatidylethanolamine/phosphatidyl-N-methylethanolamine N-methyltransferase n=1 Tax=Rivibacter subsaxonicus TaxID=457575 RepID=A0A4V6MEP4_9BURK|nr:methyltransferase domain-containing protein [Rivibacter subsaxonicus]RZU00846.1 phosphatidylethanolamine/phosphatidyl-N-methylethanolamine N-methyltransferase [Rivibacter subsaxonicus]